MQSPQRGAQGAAPSEEVWQFEEAKARFGAVVDAAIAGQPQPVMRGGKPVVVVIAAEDYERLRRLDKTNLPAVNAKQKCPLLSNSEMSPCVAAPRGSCDTDTERRRDRRPGGAARASPTVAGSPGPPVHRRCRRQGRHIPRRAPGAHAARGRRRRPSWRPGAGHPAATSAAPGLNARRQGWSTAGL